ncbi:MAG TPA: DNA-formamidopyrimidine glycosylase family protein [Actinomycetota bacterium]|nr:DNA-formamidopyrimidine glycosylase family protein [Actinomycetota bacterium]
MPRKHMAEGHTIHRLAIQLRDLIGPPLGASSPQGRFPDAKVLDGLPLLETDAHGKHLFLRFDVAWVHVHLGLAGTAYFVDASVPAKPQVRLRLAGSDTAWDLVAPTKCELLDDQAVKSIHNRLGPDPLRSDADPELVWNRLQRYSGAIGAAVLDQKVIAGVGNVYRAEALYALSMAPTRRASSLSREEFDRLWATLKSMMEQGVRDGRIITVDLPPDADRQALPQEEARYVYKQSACRRCGAPVEVAAIGGRTSYACTREQS